MSSRQPKLILRESCIEDVIQDWPTGSFLELGAGTGYTIHFAKCERKYFHSFHSNTALVLSERLG